MKKYLSFLLILTLLFSLPVFSASAESNCPILPDEGFEIAVLYDESREENDNVRTVPIADLLSTLEQKNISRMIPSRNRDTIKDGIALKLFGEGVKPRSFFISREGILRPARLTLVGNSDGTVTCDGFEFYYYNAFSCDSSVCEALWSTGSAPYDEEGKVIPNYKSESLISLENRFITMKKYVETWQLQENAVDEGILNYDISTPVGEKAYPGNSRLDIAFLVYNLLARTEHYIPLADGIFFDDCADPRAEAIRYLGIVEGTAPRTFSPDATVTGQQMALIVTRLYELLGYTPEVRSEGDVLYASDNVAPWAKEAVLQLMTDGHIYRDYNTGRLLADRETVFAADGAMDRLTALRWLCDLFEKACGNVSSDETTEETVQPTE